MAKQNYTDIEKKIFSTFSEVAGTLGYSPLHGQIIGVLIVKDGPVSLQEIARETGYSASMVSLSLDLLEVLGTVKKIKKVGDRKLYVEMHGNLLECLKNAIMIKVKNSISNSLRDFESKKKEINGLAPNDKKRVMQKLDILEKEIKRLEHYVNMLSELELP